MTDEYEKDGWDVLVNALVAIVMGLCIVALLVYIYVETGAMGKALTLAVLEMAQERWV